jgi:hypothetical protein
MLKFSDKRHCRWWASSNASISGSAERRPLMLLLGGAPVTRRDGPTGALPYAYQLADEAPITQNEAHHAARRL